MNCKPGDLAYIVVPAGFDRILDGRVVEVGINGKCQLGTIGMPGNWLCRFPSPWIDKRTERAITVCWLLDAWLRPINGVPVDDEVTEEITA